MDRFANLAIYTALRNVRVSADLWSKYGDPENLLFRQQDFVEPAGSALLKDLWALPDHDAQALTGHLVLASIGPLSDVPLLNEIVSSGAVRPLSKAEEGRVEGLLSARPSALRRSKFDPRGQKTDSGSSAGAKTELVRDPPTDEMRRRAPFLMSEVLDSTPALKAVSIPPPLPTGPVPPPLPVMAAVPVPPPLPEPVVSNGVPPPLPLRPPRMPEMLPHPLPALRTGTKMMPAEPPPQPSPELPRFLPIPFQNDPLPASPPGPIAKLPTPRRSRSSSSKKHGAGDNDDDYGYWRNQPMVYWGMRGTIALLLVGLLVWGLWPKSKSADAGSSRSELPRIQSCSPEKIELAGGNAAQVTVKIDRRLFTGRLVLKIDGLPLSVHGARNHPLRPKQDIVILPYTAEQEIEAGEFPLTVSLWAEAALADGQPIDRKKLTLLVSKAIVPVPPVDPEPE